MNFGTVSVGSFPTGTGDAEFILMWRDSVVALSGYRAEDTETNAAEFAALFGVTLDTAYTGRGVANCTVRWGTVTVPDDFALALLKRHKEHGSNFNGYFECEPGEPCPFG